ncbi:MAG: DNA-formamidopyrimidine glycosylase family protein [Verrucomicrobiota bacterium]
MPELAEVEYYRKQWAVAEGQQVAAVEVNPAKRVFRDTDVVALVSGLTGSLLRESSTYAKQISFLFGKSHWLGVHLGMTGKLRVADTDYLRAKHDHLVLRMANGASLVFTDPRLFGKLLYANVVEPPWLQDLPPAILSEAFTLDWQNEFLDRRARSPIKAVLLMQQRFPGIGNWMADEVLWRARISPRIRAGALSAGQRAALYERLREVCEDAMRVIGTDWGRPPDTWLFNHRWKDGGTCPETGKPLVREAIGGRTTCWSPAWQKPSGEL